MQVLRTEDVQSLTYKESNVGLEVECENLKSGKNASLIARPRGPGIKYFLIVAPGFNKQALSLWMGTVESTDPEWHSLWDSLLTHKGFRFVCLGLEEGVELEDRHLTEATFPWTEWPAVIGAL